MKLVERISQKEGTTPQQQQRSMIGSQAAKRERNATADGFQQLKLAVHNRLFETLDVSRLESLEANMASQKVTVAISEFWMKKADCSPTRTARGLSRKSKTNCSAWVHWNRCCGTTR